MVTLPKHEVKIVSVLHHPAQIQNTCDQLDSIIHDNAITKTNGIGLEIDKQDLALFRQLSRAGVGNKTRRKIFEKHADGFLRRVQRLQSRERLFHTAQQRQETIQSLVSHFNYWYAITDHVLKQGDL